MPTTPRKRREELQKNRRTMASFAVEDVAIIIGSANRIGSYLLSLQPAAGVEIGLPDWLFLRALARDGELPLASLGRKIGVSRKRGQQLAAQLRTTGLIAISDTANAKSARLSLSEAGRELLAQFDKLIASELSGKGVAELRTIQGAARSAQRAMRILASKGIRIESASARDDT